LQALTDKCNALQTELVHLSEEWKQVGEQLEESKEKGGCGGCSDDVYAETIATKTQDVIPHYQALISAGKANQDEIARWQASIYGAKEIQAVLEAHKESKTKEEIIYKVMEQTHSKQDDGESSTV
jgi:hypothetical protein